MLAKYVATVQYVLLSIFLDWLKDKIKEFKE